MGQIIMDLKEFSQLTLHSANSAKNFMSFMLGYSFDDLQQSEKAIIGLFESFPEEYKKDKKLFTPMFEKFFRKFKVNENNIQYYNEFITDKAMQAYVIEKNPQWSWETTTLEYKSIIDWCKAFNNTINLNNKQRHIVGAKFLEDNHESLQKFIKISKTKTQAALINKDVMKFLLKVEYSQYKDFCKKYSFDHIKILSEMYFGDNYYGFGGYFQHTKNNSIKNSELTELLEDLMSVKKEFFKESEFIKFTKLTTSNMHVSVIFMQSILHKMPDVASTFYTYFKDEILTAVNHSKDRLQPYEDLDLNAWISFSKTLGHVNVGSLDNFKNAYKNIELFESFSQYHNIIKNTEKLENELPQKTGVIKKFKI
jgi:hypothetical protein